MTSADAMGRLRRHLRRQSVDCAELGSAFYARLLDLAAAEVEEGDLIAAVLDGYDNRGDDVVPLRLLSALHRLVLAGDAPALRARYPSVGGDGDADAAWPAVLTALAEHREMVADVLTRAPQTNEPGRAAGLVGALQHLVARRDLPVRLLEIGASAGLNLRADRFRITTSGDGTDRPGSTVAGPGDSPVTLVDGWTGNLPPAVQPRVVERRGCDVAPIDPTTADGALTLLSYVWPDQRVRWDRLKGALAIARTTPADVVRLGAADFLADLEPSTGHWTVVWHSVMWQYVDLPEQRRVIDSIARAGEAATTDAPLAHVSLEPYGARFLVAARTWPDLGLGLGREVVADGQAVLGVGAPHGIPVTWN